MSRPKFTVPMLAQRKALGDKLVMITVYDATFARLADEAGVDLFLVGDSLGMVVQGHETTLNVSLDEMAYHCEVVTRSRPHALVVGDLPFGTYQASAEQAVKSAVKLVKSGAEAVKLEGGVSVADRVEAITRSDIPVFGHIGLTPQSVHRMGGHKVQGKQPGHNPGGRDRIVADAKTLESAGACAVVLEGIPRDLAADITHTLQIPTIGIGAGPDCDGQVLVLHDVLGLSDSTFKFVKAYANLRETVVNAITDFATDVRGGDFPTDAHSFH
jgi:3-methyl-2-oxobutanoate hydroxymethyltransferase